MSDASLWMDAIPGYYDDAHPEDEANWPVAHQYVVCRGPRYGGARAQYTHIVTKTIDYLPDAYSTYCSTTKRGRLVDGPSAEHPLCKKCSDYDQGIYRRRP